MIDISFPKSVDSTMLTTFDSCPTKFFQEFVLRRVPIGRSIDLHAGGCMAEAFDLIRSWYYTNTYSLEECYQKAFVVFVRKWGWLDPPLMNYKDFYNSWAAVMAYFEQYPPEYDYFQPVRKEDGTPATEFRFAIPMDVSHPDTGDPLLFSGRADLLCQPDNDPRVYVMDEKTTKTMGPQWAYQWPMRGQFYGYTKAAREYGYNCVGAVVRGIAIQQTQFKFQECVITLDDWQLETWWQNAQFKAQQAVNYYIDCRKAESQSQRHGAWPKSFGDACNDWGSCRFMDLCTSRKPWEIYESWEERIWDPLAQDPASESEDKMKDIEPVSLAEAMGEAGNKIEEKMDEKWSW